MADAMTRHVDDNGGKKRERREEATINCAHHLFEYSHHLVDLYF